MAELTQVLGTILKDVAQSRVISDVFSRDISEHYAQDPILIAFPVPRVEIKEASIQLKFAVNSVEQKKLDTAAIARERVSQFTAALGNEMHDKVILASPNKDVLVAILDEKGTDLPATATALLEQAIAKSPDALRAALASKPQALTNLAQNTLQNALRRDEEVWKIVRKGVLVRDIRATLADIVAPAVESMVKDVKDTIDRADKHAVSVDVAVSHSELLDLPETILSHVSIIAEIRNYEWTQVGGTDEQPIRRLQPE